MLQNHSSPFIQNAVAAGTIAQIQANGELPSVEGLASPCPHNANLLHCIFSHSDIGDGDHGPHW